MAEEYKIELEAEISEGSIERVRSQIDSLGKDKVKINVDGSGAKEAEKNVKAVGNALTSASGKANTFGSIIKRALGFGSAAAVAVQTIRAIKKAAKEAAESIKEIDESITNLRIVTNESYETVSRWIKSYNEMAKSLGSTTTQVADSATTWMRQGKTTAETNVLIKDSVMLAKNGMIETADAADFLTTSMKGYKVSVEDTINIVDKLSKLDSEAAVTAGDLAEGMSNVSQMANDVGINMDTLLGQLAATGEVVGDVGKVGTGLKTIYSRMSDIKANKLELVDEDGTTETLSNVEATLSNVGIDLRATVTEFNSFDEVLSNLADQWDSLGSVQQAALSKVFAGTRQQNVFRTLMANYDKVRQYTDSAANSAGAAEKKFSAFLESIEAKTNTLKASFESLAINTISGESVKGVIDATSAIITFLDKTNALKGALAGFTTYGALKGFEILAGGIKSAYTNLNEFNSALKFLKAGNIGEAQLQVLTTMTSNLSKSQLEAIVSSEALNNEQRMAILTAQGMTTAEAEATLSTLGLATAEGTASGATATFSGALKGLWATLKANPFILIAAAIAAMVVAISAYENRSKDAAEKLKDSADEVSEIQSEVTDLNSELSTTKKRIEELQRKGSLTIVEQNELNKLQSVSAELERQIALKQRALAISQSKNADNFVNAVNTKMDEDGGNGWWFGYRNYGDFKTNPNKTAEHPNRPEANTTGQNSKQKNMFQWRLEDYLEAEQKYQAALKAGNDQEAQQWADRKTQLDTAMDGYVQDLQGYLDDLGEYDYASLSDDAKQAIDYINDVQNAYLMAVDKNKNSKSVFYNIYDQGRFAEGKQAVEDLKEAGTLTAEAFERLYNSNDSVKAMIDNMQEIGFINDTTAQTFKGLTNQILGTADALEAANEQEKITFDVFITDDNIKDTINDLKNNLSDLSTALEDLRNGDLSDSDILELIEKFPELANRTDDLDTALSELIDTTKDEVGNQFTMWEGNMVTDDDIEKLNAVKTTLTSIGDTANSISKATAEISKLKTSLDDLSDTYSDIKGIIEDYNEVGYLTNDNLQSIMDLEPEYINLLIDENGQINLNNQAYKDYIISKAKSLLVNQLTSLYDTILNMKVEEAQAYANAKAFDEETRSVKDLLTETTKLYIVQAQAKDEANNTTAYMDALTRSFSTAANYASMVESYINSLNTTQNEFSTSASDATSALEDEKDALEDAKDALEDYQDELEDAQSSLNDLIDLVTDYIKQIKEDEKDALNEEIDALEKQKDALDESKDKYAEIINAKKEALKLAKEEKEAQDELSDKQKSVAKDKLALEVAGLDDSSAGKKAYKQAKDNLVSSQKDLSDYLYDQAYDKQVAELEDLQEIFEEGIEKRKAQIDSQVEHIETKIDEIDKYLDNSRQMYEDACAMIDNDNGELYSNLWNYTYTYTTQTKAEFDHLWTSAQEAIQKYKGDNDTLIGTMETLQGEIYNAETEIDRLDKAIDITNQTIDSTSGAIDNVSSSLDSLGSSITDYMSQLAELSAAANNMDITPNADGNKTRFYVTHNGKTYETGYNYNGDTEGNRLLAAAELTKKIAQDISGFDQYGLGIVQGYLGVGLTGAKEWYVDVNGKRYTAVSKTKDNAIKQIMQQGLDPRAGYYVRQNIKHYAKGTRSADEFSITQEKGLEALFVKNPNGSGSYTLTTPKSQVFDHKRTDNLYDFSGNPEEYTAKMLEKGLSPLSADELSNFGLWGNSLAAMKFGEAVFTGANIAKEMTNGSRDVYNNDNSVNNNNYTVNVTIPIQGNPDPSVVRALDRFKPTIKKEIINELVRIGEKYRR